jgi:hypothetical protein
VPNRKCGLALMHSASNNAEPFGLTRLNHESRKHTHVRMHTILASQAKHRATGEGAVTLAPVSLSAPLWSMANATIESLS